MHRHTASEAQHLSTAGHAHRHRNRTAPVNQQGRGAVPQQTEQIMPVHAVIGLTMRYYRIEFQYKVYSDTQL